MLTSMEEQTIGKFVVIANLFQERFTSTPTPTHTRERERERDWMTKEYQ